MPNAKSKSMAAANKWDDLVSRHFSHYQERTSADNRPSFNAKTSRNGFPDGGVESVVFTVPFGSTLVPSGRFTSIVHAIALRSCMTTGRPAHSAGGWGLSQSLSRLIVDDVKETDLYLRPVNADGPDLQSHSAFPVGKTCSKKARTFNLVTPPSHRPTNVFEGIQVACH